MRRGGRREALRRQIDTPGTEPAEMQPHRGSARAAIEEKGDRARGRILCAETFPLRISRRVVDVENIRPRRAVILQHRDRARLRQVTYFRTAERHFARVFLRLFLLRLLVLLRFLFFLLRLFFFRPGRILLGKNERGEQRSEREQSGES